MQDSIIEKVNEVIKNGVSNEPEAMYILAQSRKYLEISHPTDRAIEYPSLSLVGDWVLHSKLTGSMAISKLDEIANFFANQKQDESFEFMKNGFTLFKDLRTEFVKLTAESGMNPELAVEKSRWLKFVLETCKILKDLPLNSTGTVKEFKINDSLVIDSRHAISFTITFTDGRTYHFSISEELISF